MASAATADRHEVGGHRDDEIFYLIVQVGDVHCTADVVPVWRPRRELVMVEIDGSRWCLSWGVHQPWSLTGVLVRHLIPKRGVFNTLAI
jgi:hypothetical protein